MSTLAVNKRALFDYEILKKYEGGLVLTGPEVKSARNKQFQLKGAFVQVRDGEVWLKNAYIAKYGPAGPQEEYDPYRNRKVLVHKRELSHLIGKQQADGLTLVPLSVFLKGRLIKLEFGIGRGKKKYEKRETIKKRELDRNIRESMKS